MELTDILAVSGKPGLYKLVTSNNSRLIVESLDDGKKRPISATNKISSLGDIAIFTLEEDVPLKDVFAAIYAKTGGKEAPSHKGNAAELRTFLSDILDDLDHDRVYDSDLKKLFQWFNILLGVGAFEATDETEEELIQDAEVEEITTDEESDKEA